MNLLFTRLSTIILYVVIGWVLSVYDWHTLSTISYIVAIFQTCVTLIAYYIEIYNPTMWVRHKTSTEARDLIIANGFNGETNERVRNRDIDKFIGGQRQEDVISTSYLLDGAWSRMVDKQYPDMDTDYIYLKVPVTRVAINKAVTTTWGVVDDFHGVGVEFTVTREAANAAIANGNYSLNKPKDYFNVMYLIYMIGSFCTSISYNDSYNIYKLNKQ